MVVRLLSALALTISAAAAKATIAQTSTTTPTIASTTASAATARTDSVKAAEMRAELARLERLPLKTAADSHAMASKVRRLHRQNLVGSAAAPIVGDHWLNTTDGRTQYIPTGKVTFITFTAFWCGPCKASYPTIVRLAEEYRAKGVESIVEMRTYGYFDDEQNISPAREAELLRKFYVDKYKFQMPIAIVDVPPDDAQSGAKKGDPNQDAYALTGYPMFVIVGKDGIIKTAGGGWGGEGSERGLRVALDKALAE